MEYLLLALGFLVSYLLGSIPTSVWVGKWFFNKDIREEGSGNAGATNTFRVLGSWAAIPVMVVDVLKGVAAVLMIGYFVPDGLSNNQLIYIQITAGFCAVIGHALPVFAGFRGGKGVATLFGVGIVLYPLAVWVAVGVFVLVLVMTAYVSLGSMIGALVFSISALFIFPSNHLGLMLLAIVVSIFIIWTHRTNIGRLWKGEENRLWKKKGTS